MTESKVSGKVSIIETTKEYGSNGFRKRLVVIEQSKGKYTNYIPLDFVQNGCDMADNFSVGDEVEFTYRLTGRRWQKDEKSPVRYFLGAEVMQFNVIDHAAHPASTTEYGEPVPETKTVQVQPQETKVNQRPLDGDEIPF